MLILEIFKNFILGIEIPSIEVLSFLAGAILLFIAIIGGGLNIKEIVIPRISPFFRILSAGVGILFVLLGYGKTTDDITPEKTEIPVPAGNNVYPEDRVYCQDCKAYNITWMTGDTQYEALLIYNPVKGYGRMRVKYLFDNKYTIIQEEIYQKSTDQGIYLEGRNPFDISTSLPKSSYVPDNLVVDNESILVFDKTGSYEATIVQISDLITLMNEFGFTSYDIDF